MSEPAPSTPQRYRFVVRSAEEAITVLRERLGPKARVVSVQQVESGGIARFLQSPKLEVIAEVASDEAAFVEPTPEALNPPPVEETGVQLKFSSAAQETLAHSSPRLAASPPIPERPRRTERPVETAPPSVSPLARLLQSAGLPKLLLSRLQMEDAWRQWEGASPAAAINAIGSWLRNEWRTRRPLPLGQRIAFVGSPGAGKTTALCKQLAVDVFCHQRRAVVLKLDLAHANPGDGLAVVCEAFGAIFARDVAELPDLGPSDVLYVDVPGVSPLDALRTSELGEALAPLGVASRILVANAAYESTLLKRALAWGVDLGCEHAVFTHLDELTHWGKLWEFAFHPRITTLALGTGQNIAGDVESNVFDAILDRTLPREEEAPATRPTAVAA